MDRPGFGFYALAAVFAAFVIFLYGPIVAIVALSFQGPDGGLTFPMRGVSLHWFRQLFEGAGPVDLGAAFRRSLALAVVVMLVTVVLSVMAGMAFRRPFRGATALLYTAIASLVVPSIVVSLGLALEFRLVDGFLMSRVEGFESALGLWTSGLGAHLTWTLPFGLLIMFAIFNRFDHRLEEAARDLGATAWQGFRHVTLPIIAPAVAGVGILVFTLSWDELARSSQVMGTANTLPMQLSALSTTVTTPQIYALGTMTTLVSALVVGALLLLMRRLGRRGR